MHSQKTLSRGYLEPARAPAVRNASHTCCLSAEPNMGRIPGSQVTPADIIFSPAQGCLAFRLRGHVATSLNQKR